MIYPDDTFIKQSSVTWWLNMGQRELWIALKSDEFWGVDFLLCNIALLVCCKNVVIFHFLYCAYCKFWHEISYNPQRFSISFYCCSSLNVIVCCVFYVYVSSGLTDWFIFCFELLGEEMANTFLCWVCMFSPCMYGYSGLLPPSKNMHVRLIGDSKFFLGVRCGCAWLCLVCLSLAIQKSLEI